MKTVERPPYARNPREEIATEAETVARIYRKLDGSQDPIPPLGGLARNGQRIALYAGAMGDPVVTRRGLRIMADAVVALFRLAAHPGESTTFAIEDVSFTVFIPGQHRTADPIQWMNAFSAAAAVRHASAMRELVEVTREVLDHSQLTAVWHSYAFPRVYALQALARRDPSAGALLASVRAEAAKLDRDDTERDLLVAEMALAERLHEGNAAAFNDALERALLAHRAHWTRAALPDESIANRSNHPDGFIALLPLALACLAHDRGIAIEIESAYIPRWIVVGG